MLTESPQPNLDAAPGGGLGARFWLLVPVLGVGAGAAAGLLTDLLRTVEKIAWHQHPGGMLLDAIRDTSPAHRIAVVLTAGVITAVVRWWLGRSTGGHGAEVTEAIWFEAGRLSVPRALLQAVTSIVIVGLGASLGREAAPKQVGAAMASWMAQRAGLHGSRARLLTAIGTGAGIAAVYNVPLGGALFSLEVLLGTLSLPLVPPALLGTAVATTTAWLFLPDRAIYTVPFFPPSAPLDAWALLLGPLVGAGAALYVRLIAWADARKPKRLMAVLAPLIVFGALGAAAVPLPELLGNGQNVVQLSIDGQLAVLTLAALLVLKPLATAACLGSGAPGGLFTPTLAFGAVFGALTGQLCLLVAPHTPAGAFALVGATAMLAATSQGPISAVVLALELTRQLDTLMVPLALAVGGAVLVARWIDRRSIYTGRIHAGRAQAGDDGLTSISAAARYAELLQVLLRRPDAAKIEVRDKAGEAIGAVTANRVRSPQPEDAPLQIATAGDFLGPQRS